jgi:hypothetical protein
VGQKRANSWSIQREIKRKGKEKICPFCKINCYGTFITGRQEMVPVLVFNCRYWYLTAGTGIELPVLV